MAKEKNFSNTDKTQPKKVRIELNDGSVYWLEEENIKKMFSNTPGAKKPNGDVTKVFSNTSGVKKPDGDVTKVFSKYLKQEGQENTDKAQPKKVRIELNDGSVYWLEEENIKKIFSNTPGAKEPNGDMTELFSNTPGVKKPDGDVTKVFSNYSNSTEEQNDKAKATISDAIRMMLHKNRFD